jgi:hypothetical protein
MLNNTSEKNLISIKETRPFFFFFLMKEIFYRTKHQHTHQHNLHTGQESNIVRE